MNARLRITNGHHSDHAAEVIHLREAAQVMHALQQQWETVTTATRPGHEYVTATTTLHANLSAIERESLLPSIEIGAAKRIDVDQALADLGYAATDLTELTYIGARLPEPLIRSEVRFAPARVLPSTMERIHDRTHNRYVPIRLSEGADLAYAATQAARAAQQVRTTLEISLRPAAAGELTAQPLIGGPPRRGLEPVNGLGGPGLF